MRLGVIKIYGMLTKLGGGTELIPDFNKNNRYFPKSSIDCFCCKILLLDFEKKRAKISDQCCQYIVRMHTTEPPCKYWINTITFSSVFDIFGIEEVLYRFAEIKSRCYIFQVLTSFEISLVCLFVKFSRKFPYYLVIRWKNF